MKDKLLSAVVNLGKGAAVTFGLLMLVTTANAISSTLGLGVAAGIGLLAVLTIVDPRPEWWVPNRFAAWVIALVALLAFGVAIQSSKEEEKARIAELRRTDANGYLSAIRASASDEVFVAEAKDLLRSNEPQTYLHVIQGKVSDDVYLAEMRELNPAAYEAEVARRVAEQRAQEEAREAALKAEHQALVDMLPGVKNLPLAERNRIYARLAELDPQNKSYKKESERLKALAVAEEKEAAAARAQAERVARARTAPVGFLQLVKFSWSKEGFGNVMLASFTIKNSAPIDIKDIEIRCQHSAPSGTVIDSNTETIYDFIKANSTRTFREVNMGFIHSQAARSGCDILSASAK